jgi:hypothetical protein
VASISRIPLRCIRATKKTLVYGRQLASRYGIIDLTLIERLIVRMNRWMYGFISTRIEMSRFDGNIAGFFHAINTPAETKPKPRSKSNYSLPTG